MFDEKENYHKIAKYINHTVILPDFISTIADIECKWTKDDRSAVCNCPMSWHQDRNASFHMNFLNDLWVYHCFGCGSSGNAVKFYIEYTGDDYYTAIKNICERLNIKSLDGLEIPNNIETINKISKKKEIDSKNIIISNRCRLLLHRKYDEYNQWIMSIYKKLNNAIDEENLEKVNEIDMEVNKTINNIYKAKTT